MNYFEELWNDSKVLLQEAGQFAEEKLDIGKLKVRIMEQKQEKHRLLTQLGTICYQASKTQANPLEDNKYLDLIEKITSCEEKIGTYQNKIDQIHAKK